jgi:hypothetical protein
MNEVPDWIYEEAEVWVYQNRGSWGRQEPRPAKVVRFTAQRIVVMESVLGEVMFTKEKLEGIGKAGNYMLLRPDDEKVISTLRTAAVKKAMARLREVAREMQLGGRIGWDDLPDAREAAEAFHEASYEAIRALEQASEQYGDGERRDVRV